MCCHPRDLANSDRKGLASDGFVKSASGVVPNREAARRRGHSGVLLKVWCNHNNAEPGLIAGDADR